MRFRIILPWDSQLRLARKLKKNSYKEKLSVVSFFEKIFLINLNLILLQIVI